MTGSNDNSRNGKRLDTWKEIGGFFGRDERTVKRWEMTRKLPVHRVPGGGRANVYAYEGELAEWLRSNESQVETAQTDSERDERAAASDDSGKTASGESSGTQDGQNAADTGEATAGPEKRSWRSSGLILVALVIVAVVTGLLIYKWRDWMTSGGTALGKTGSHQVAPESEELYLKGIYYWHNRTPESLNQAVDYFTQAIVRDPNNAEAYVGLANCYNLLREYSTMPESEAYPRAIAAAKRAIALDESLSGAHSSLGFAEYFWLWDAPGAQKEFQRALELDPKSVNAHHWYATMLLSLGRDKESLEEIDKAEKLDPQSSAILADQGLIMSSAGMKDQAVAQLKQLEASQPNFLSPHNYLSGIYFHEHDYHNFLAESKTAATLQHDDSRLKIVAAGEKGLETSGYRGMLTAMLGLQKNLYAQNKFSAHDLAVTYGLLGENKDAMKFLQIGYEKHEGQMLEIRNDASFAGLHQDQEFQQLLQKLGLPPLE